jgi:transposase
VLLSLPGVGRRIGATVLSEASQALAERDYHALRCYAGIAPVTRQSGKKQVVVMRRGCNERLRNAFYHWSRVSTQCDPHSKEHYARLRAKGHSHGRALRGVTDRLLAVLMAMLEAGTVYDASRRTQSAA